MITINRDKAEEITKNVIREYRKPLLESLDVDFVRALETGEDTKEIAKKKQELRDMPDKAKGKSVEELKVIIEDLNNA